MPVELTKREQLAKLLVENDGCVCRVLRFEYSRCLMYNHDLASVDTTVFRLDEKRS